MYLGEKVKIKKRIKNDINKHKKKNKCNNVSKYLAIFLHYNTQKIILYIIYTFYLIK